MMLHALNVAHKELRMSQSELPGIEIGICVCCSTTQLYIELPQLHWAEIAGILSVSL